MENINLVILAALLAANLVGFALVGIDKSKSVRNSERVPEVHLFFVAVFFAALGVFLGMFAFRHKIRKAYFPIGVGFLLLEQIALTYLVINYL